MDNSKTPSYLSPEARILAFIKLGKMIANLPADQIHDLARRASGVNNWFDEPNVSFALKGIARMLEEQYLREWVYEYDLDPKEPKKVGVIMAGNIPMVGFHDFLSVLISGHILLGKLSSEDPQLMRYLADLLIQIEPLFAERIMFVEMLKEADAIIATGSDNSARYFEYYFAKKPHIIRKNRSSIAVLTGKETPEELAALGNDIFRYYGLGCRNISKMLVPEGYDFVPFFEANEAQSAIIDHHKYRNNYEYNKSIYLVNRVHHYDNGFLLVTKSEQFVSPISVLYYDTFASVAELTEKLANLKEKTQCVVSANGWLPNSIDFGQAQCPMVWDYADGVDTMKFLASLS